MRMLKPICSLLALFLLVFAAQAQIRPLSEDEARSMIKADPSRSADFLHRYEVPEINDTKAPKGYKPCYISHFGRHGERYRADLASFDRSIAPLAALDSAGLLSEKGKQLLSDIRFLREEHVGMEGILTARGAATHRGISGRMCGRYPQVFKQKGRDSVYCVSTPVHRCIQSMGNFSLSLKEFNPKLRIALVTGDYYREYLNTYFRDETGQEEYRAWRNIILSDSSFGNLFASLVTDKEAAADLCSIDYGRFFDYLMGVLNIAQCLDGPQPYTYTYLSEETLWKLWNLANAKRIITYAFSEEGGCRRPKVVGGPIIRDFVEKADRALEGGPVCADFRFGHDTGVMPLVSALNLNGLGEKVKALESPWTYPVFRAVPMGANVQMVFFRGRRGDVLVKVLLNETECTVPGLEDCAVNEVYYPWKQFREYLVSKI